VSRRNKIKKRKTLSKAFRIKIWHVIVLLVVFIFFFLIYLQKVDNISAAARFDIELSTPRDQIQRGGEVEFVIDILGNNSSSARTGIQYDGRKVELLEIVRSDAGDIQREPIANDGNLTRLIISSDNVPVTEARQTFARLRFRIIDTTDEVDEQGRGFTQICTLFDPGDVSPPRPTTSPASPTSQLPLTTATSTSQQPTNTSVPIPTGQSRPSSTLPSANELDKSLSCIPIRVNGSNSDKLDITIYGGNYRPEQFDRFLEHAVRSVAELEKTNLTDYRSDVLNKMNWYVYNHLNVLGPNEVLTQERAQSIVSNPKCPQDRYLILINDPYVGGLSAFGIGGFVGTGSFGDPDYIVAAHEWGHYVGELSDEYEGGGFYPTNCTTSSSDRNPQGDPCPDKEQCRNENDPMYQQPCSNWNCSIRDCNALQEQLYEGSGCYPRCGDPRAYRPRPRSVMDRSMFFFPTEDTFKFNGPSLYSIISLLDRYK